MRFRSGLLLLLTLSLACEGFAQNEPPTAATPATPTTQPASPPRTVAELLARVEGRLERGRALMRAGARDEAELVLKDAQRGLEIVMGSGGSNIEAEALAGDIAMELGDSNTARSHYLKVVAIEQANFRANLGLGRYYAVTHLWRQASAYLEKASSVAPTDKRSEVLRLLAICYSGQGKRREAEATALEAVQANPDDYEAWQFLVRARLDVERYAAAVEAAESLVAAVANDRATEPAEASKTQALIRAYETLQQALTRYHNSLYKRNARNEPTDELMVGNEREAARVLARISATVEAAADLRRELSFHERLTYLKKAIEYQPDHTGLLLEQASLLNATHQTDEAIAVCQDVLAIASPADDDPRAAEENKAKAREFLLEQGAPLEKPPTQENEAPEEPDDSLMDLEPVQPAPQPSESPVP